MKNLYLTIVLLMASTNSAIGSERFTNHLPPPETTRNIIIATTAGTILVLTAPEITAIIASEALRQKSIAFTTVAFQKAMPVIERGVATAVRRQITAGVSALMFSMFH